MRQYQKVSSDPFASSARSYFQCRDVRVRLDTDHVRQVLNMDKTIIPIKSALIWIVVLVDESDFFVKKVLLDRRSALG